MADRQFEAYHGMTPDDAWNGDLSSLPVEEVHEPITNVYQVRLPEEYENDGLGWDSERQGPKTPEEANAALRARIADYGAPDARFYDYVNGDQ